MALVALALTDTLSLLQRVAPTGRSRPKREAATRLRDEIARRPSPEALAAGLFGTPVT